jgi:hypothetical protein
MESHQVFMCCLSQSANNTPGYSKWKFSIEKKNIRVWMVCSVSEEDNRLNEYDMKRLSVFPPKNHSLRNLTSKDSYLRYKAGNGYLELGGFDERKCSTALHRIPLVQSDSYWITLSSIKLEIGDRTIQSPQLRFLWDVGTSANCVSPAVRELLEVQLGEASLFDSSAKVEIEVGPDQFVSYHYSAEEPFLEISNSRSSGKSIQ